jgi:NADPH2:quinone reductase
MKAVHQTGYGPANVFEIVEVARPEPGPRDVLVKVDYAGLRWSDLLARRGTSARAPVELPFTPGTEAVGVVAEVGSEVTAFKPGDRVMAQPSGGGYAEYLKVPAARVEALADGVDLAGALVYRVNLFPAYFAIFELCRIQDGETVMIHSAAGGVGQVAVQVLKRRFKDVKVIGLTGSDEKVAAVLANGADHAINYKAQDHVKAVGAIVGVKPPFHPNGPAVGVDAILNGVGGESLKTDPRVLRKLGRWAIFGGNAGMETINPLTMVYESFSIFPFSMLTFTGTPAWDRAQAFIADWLETETLTQPIVHPIEDIVKVHEAFERGDLHGKLAFRI